MNTETTIEARLAALEARGVSQRKSFRLLGFAAACIAVAGWYASRGNDVLRLKGLIIVDAQGRDRLLIGAPIPFSEDRVRTDTTAVKAMWAAGMPEGYMNWYAGYRHDINGLLVMDENGVDRLAIGQDYPDPIIGQRIGRGTGLIINDTMGLERSGYGLLTVEGEDRVVLGIDGNNGSEGVSMVLLEDGTAGFMINDNVRQRRILLGQVPTEGEPADSVRFGLMLIDRNALFMAPFQREEVE